MSSGKNSTNKKAKKAESAAIDFSDISELTKEDFARGHFRNWKPAKKAVSFRIDLDNLEWLKKKGSGYQKRMNEVLRWARFNGCPIA